VHTLTSDMSLGRKADWSSYVRTGQLSSEVERTHCVF